MVFTAEMASKYDQWYQSPEGQYADAQEKELFLRLVQPKRGESLLEVGCGTGHNLEFFKGLSLEVTGIDSSEPMLQMAAKKLGNSVRLSLGQADELRFDDGSFDIVALITLLEFLPNPKETLREAIRVTRRKVYIGVLNKASLLGVARRVRSRFRKDIYSQARFYTVWELERMVRGLGEVSFVWKGVLFLPLGWQRRCHKLDRFLTLKRNPFSGFLGIYLTKGG